MTRKSLLLLLIASVEFPLEAAPPSVTFAPPVTLTSRFSGRPVSLSLGDFEGDGRRDIAVAYADGTSTVFHNSTIGIVGPRVSHIDTSPLVSPAGGGDVVFGDLNKDGADDWIQTGTTAGANPALIIAGGTGPTFLATVPFPSRELQLADLDGDGNLDLIVGYDQTSGVCSVLRGRGDASFGNAASVPVSGGPALAILDWNGDGALDLLAGSAHAPRVSASINTGALTFAAPQTVATLPGDTSSFVEGIAARSRSSLESAALAISIRDDAAARHALYVVSADNPSQVIPIANGKAALHATFADMNRDNRADLVIVDADSRHLSVRAGETGESWPVVADIEIPATEITAAVVGDVSGDGIPDVVVAAADGTLLVYVNVGPRHRATRH